MENRVRFSYALDQLFGCPPFFDSQVLCNQALTKCEGREENEAGKSLHGNDKKVGYIERGDQQRQRNTGAPELHDEM